MMLSADVVTEVLNECRIKILGFCDFNKVKNDLINCRSRCRLKENTKTIISCAFPYKISLEDGCARNISRYAVIQDYHVILRRILSEAVVKLQESFSENYFDFFIDSSPIPEIKAACYCGLGVVGDNGLLIVPKYGSWVFLAEIVTDLGLVYEDRKIKGCLHCGLCKRMCPSLGALEDKTLCISKVSQQKGQLTDFQKSLLKRTNSVWGCDICQEVCPMNNLAEDTYLSEFEKNVFPFVKIGDYDKLENRAFQWRPKNVIERNIKIFDCDDFSEK